MIAMLSQQLHSAGGPVLIVLGLISVAALAIGIFKAIQFARIGVGRTSGAASALHLWSQGNHQGAMREVRTRNSPTASAVMAAMYSLMQSPGDYDRARDIAANVALERLNVMSKNLRFLETVAQAAPMLGLLGTVIGMISAFGELSSKGGAIDPAALAGGIWVALITTAAGLSVAIPAYFLSMWFEARVDQERATMEAAIAQVLLIRPPSAVPEPLPTPPPAMAPSATPMMPRAAVPFGN